MIQKYQRHENNNTISFYLPPIHCHGAEKSGLNNNAVALKNEAFLDSTELIRIDSIVEKGRNQVKLPGVSIAIMQGDKIILAKRYGFADRERSLSASAFTVYPIGSISKHYCCGDHETC